MMNKNKSTKDDLVIVLKTGRKSLPLIYSNFRKLRRDNVPKSFEAEIRNTLQRCCAECPQYNGKDNVFRHHGMGVWSLRR
jgi:hypothetical protein